MTSGHSYLTDFDNTPTLIFSRRRRNRRPVKSNALLGDDALQENDDNYTRRFLADYGQTSGGGGGGSSSFVGSHPCHTPRHHKCHKCAGSDYSQMLELRCTRQAVPPSCNSAMYAEFQPAGAVVTPPPFSMQRPSMTPSFATFKPTSGPYKESSTSDSKVSNKVRTQPAGDQESRFIFDAEPDGPLSPDHPPDLVSSSSLSALPLATASSSEGCRHFPLYGRHRQPQINRVSNI